MRAQLLIVATLILCTGCLRSVKADFVESIADYSDYSTVNWEDLSGKYYRPNAADWSAEVSERIFEGFPMEIAARYWHFLQNARTDFHQKSLSLRVEVSKEVMEVLDQTEAMFDTVFVRCVNQEYYMRLLPEMYNETMKPAIDELIEKINAYDNLL